MEKRRRTLSITSGKGGVGKSSIVSNLAYLLSKRQETTYILDADLSLGNIDIMFGMVSRYNVKDLLEGKKHITEIVAEGPSGIRIIPATSGICEFSNLSDDERRILFSSFRDLPEYDFLLVDTSAGISSNVVYFNSMSQDIFVVLTPDPASLTDSYAVIKVLSKKTGRRNFNIIVNMAKDEKEALAIYRRLLVVSDRFLNVYLDLFGFIPMDKNITTAVRRQQLWVEHYPDSSASKALSKMCERLVG